VERNDSSESSSVTLDWRQFVGLSIGLEWIGRTCTWSCNSTKFLALSGSDDTDGLLAGQRGKD
jgi:hypothetical protein